MASDRGKRQKSEQSAGGSAPHRAKSARGGEPAQRSQTRRMRSTRKENAAVIEEAELDATVTEEVMPADGKAGKRRTRPKSAHSVKQECKQKIIAEMGQIVTGLIEKAKRGSYNEAKLLLTIADKDERQEGGEQSGASGSRRFAGRVAAGAVGCGP